MDELGKMHASDIYAVVLGTMQDGGLPHIGCRCGHCLAGQGYAASLAIVDKCGRAGAKNSVTLIDATPDIKHQLNYLASVLGQHATMPQRFRQPDALFLTHAHMGHIAGLPQLGPEAMNVQGLPVFASDGLVDLLQETRLWHPMVRQLNLQTLLPHKPVILADNVQITPIPVPHRDEWGIGTFAFRVQGPTRSLLYLPDIDSWQEWPEAEAVLSQVDVALVDGSFMSAEELNGRLPVAHPFMADTWQRFQHLPTDLWFTHLNHTNPALNGKTEYPIVTFGQTFVL